jgi:hypothetical protein
MLLGMLADIFSMEKVPHWLVLFLAGIGLLIWSVGRLRKKRLEKKTTQPAAMPRTPSASELRAMADELRQLFAELQDTSRQVAAQIQNRTSKLDSLIQEADAKIRRLEELQANKSPSTGDSRRGNDTLQAPPLPLAETDVLRDPKHRQICDLADRGKTAREIAQEAGVPQGEVELILNLRGKPIGA